MNLCLNSCLGASFSGRDGYVLFSCKKRSEKADEKKDHLISHENDGTHNDTSTKHGNEGGTFGDSRKVVKCYQCGKLGHA